MNGLNQHKYKHTHSYCTYIYIYYIFFIYIYNTGTTRISYIYIFSNTLKSDLEPKDWWVQKDFRFPKIRTFSGSMLVLQPEAIRVVLAGRSLGLLKIFLYIRRDAKTWNQKGRLRWKWHAMSKGGETFNVLILLLGEDDTIWSILIEDVYSFSTGSQLGSKKKPLAPVQLMP